MSFLKGFLKINVKHKKLSEELVLAKDNELDSTDAIFEKDAVTFKLKYLGKTPYKQTSSDFNNFEAVKTIFLDAKNRAHRNKKLQRILLLISRDGIEIKDAQDIEILKVPIFNVSNCATHPVHRNVFSFITVTKEDTMECHAFLCSKRKVAENANMAIAKAAFESYHILPKKDDSSPREESPTQDVLLADIIETYVPPSDNILEEAKLIDFDSEFQSIDSGSNKNSFSSDNSFDFETTTEDGSWTCFEDDFVPQEPKNYQRTQPLFF